METIRTSQELAALTNSWSVKKMKTSFSILWQFLWKFFIYLEHLQQLCNWNLPFVGVCQVPKRFAKGKISLSSSVWHFWLGISQNSGSNYFCPGIFHLRGKFSRASRERFLFRTQFLRPPRAIPSPVAANSLARRAAVFILQVHVAAWSRSSRSDRGNNPRVHCGI